MTVSYSQHVFTSGVGTFVKLIFRYRGSIYKLVYKDLALYVVIYFFLSGMYRFVLPEDGKLMFEKISLFCGNRHTQIPVTFVLGFYVSLLVTRWWKQFETIPWPDSSAVWISTCIKGHDDKSRLMRRTIIRYINLCLILTFRLISLPVKKRFPTLQHLEDAGILVGKEKKIFEKMDNEVNHPKYWMPCVWAGAIVTRARKENRIANDYLMQALIDRIDQFRGMAGTMINQDWVTIPLVYTQVVTLAVYTYLLSNLMARQFLDPSKNYPNHEIDLVIPWFTFLQFFFYMGWLKVAEALINPFGEDDDDFECNWIIDRNLQVSYLIVDEMHAEHPDLVKDQFWDDLYPELPYTLGAEETRTDTILGGTANYHVSRKEAEFLPMSSSEDEDDDPDRGKSDHELSEVIISSGSKSKMTRSRNESGDSGSGIEIKARPSSKPIKINKTQNGGKSYSEFGSLLSVDKPLRNLVKSSANSASGVSLASRLQSVLRGRGGPGSVLGNSHMSLMSRNSRNSRNKGGHRSRKHSSHLARSISRVSNASAVQNDTTRERNRSGDESHSEEESMFKFSSMSSIDHLQGSASDLTTSKQKQRKKYSISSGLQSPKTKLSSPTVPRRQSENQKSIVRKLELMHNFTSDAVRLLKKEENNEEEFEILKALEENHEELRRLLLKRIKTRHHPNALTSSPTMISPTSEPNFNLEDHLTIDGSEKNSEFLVLENVKGNIDDDDIDESEDVSVEEPTVYYNDNDSAKTVEIDNTEIGEVLENEEGPFDLATIEEQPELGYQSDSEAYETVIKKNSKETNKVSIPLDTLAEDIKEENHDQKD